MIKRKDDKWKVRGKLNTEKMSLLVYVREWSETLPGITCQQLGRCDVAAQISPRFRGNVNDIDVIFDSRLRHSALMEFRAVSTWYDHTCF